MRVKGTMYERVQEGRWRKRREEAEVVPRASQVDRRLGSLSIRHHHETTFVRAGLWSLRLCSCDSRQGKVGP